MWNKGIICPYSKLQPSVVDIKVRWQCDFAY
jgi:hypothetical protein